MVDNISIYFSQKIPDEIIDKYESEFGCGVKLKNVKLNCDDSREYSYDCNHPLLEQFRTHLKEWIGENDFPISYTMLTNEIRLTCFRELSEAQIHDFEVEFEVRLGSYSVSCGYTCIKYEFV